MRIVSVAAAAAVALGSLAFVGGSAGAQSSVRGVTATEITVTGIGSVATFGTADKAAKARFDAANKNKEIPGGRQIKYVAMADDKSSPDTNLSEARRLVDQVGTFAIVPAMTVELGTQSTTYLNQQKVPTIGWVSAGFCQTNNKYLYSFNGCLSAPDQQYAINVTGPTTAKMIQDQGNGSAKGKTVAILGENTDTAKAGGVILEASFKSAGFKVVYNQNPVPAPPTPVTDFTPYVQAIMTANNGQPPDVAEVVVQVPSNLLGLAGRLSAAGFKGIILHNLYAPQLTKAMAGQTAVSTMATTETNSPNMASIVATLKAAGVDPIGQPELAGYFSADMFVRILKKVGKNLTPATFQKAASKFKYEIPGVIGPTYYPQGYKAGGPCAQLQTSDGTKWTVNVPFACYNELKKKGSKWVQVPYPQGVK
jgi:branched-chain amino acid transport system substrate-binding protein